MEDGPPVVCGETREVHAGMLFEKLETFYRRVGRADGVDEGGCVLEVCGWEIGVELVLEEAEELEGAWASARRDDVEHGEGAAGNDLVD